MKLKIIISKYNEFNKCWLNEYVLVFDLNNL